jgi:hypothetical protein
MQVPLWAFALGLAALAPLLVHLAVLRLRAQADARVVFAMQRISRGRRS